MGDLDEMNASMRMMDIIQLQTSFANSQVKLGEGGRSKSQFVPGNNSGNSGSGIDIRGLKGTAISQRGLDRPITGNFAQEDDHSADENGAFFGIGQREQEVVQSSPTSNS